MSIKDFFPGYYTKSVDDFDELWAKAIFCVDTNVLLDLYKFSSQTRDKVFELLRSYNERLYLPYQVAEEFSKNRVSNIVNQEVATNKWFKSFSDIFEVITSDKSHPHFTEDLVKKAKGLLDDIKAECDAATLDLRNQINADSVFDIINEIFAGRLTPDIEDRKAAEREAATRYDGKIPPGFKDQSKVDKGNGDYFIWRQMLRLAEEKQLPLIFITNETKSDWWWYSDESKEKGRRIGPRPELINEFMKVAKQQFHIYSLSEFVKQAANKQARGAIAESIMQEIRNAENVVVKWKAAKSALAKDVEKMAFLNQMGKFGVLNFPKPNVGTPLSIVPRFANPFYSYPNFTKGKYTDALGYLANSEFEKEMPNSNEENENNELE